MIFIDIVLPVFLIIFTGWALERFGTFDMRTLSDTALLIFAPALVFTSLLNAPVVNIAQKLGRMGEVGDSRGLEANDTGTCRIQCHGVRPNCHKTEMSRSSGRRPVALHADDAIDNS